jgi:RTA1 like protein
MIYVGPGYSIIRPSFVTPVFVGLDVLAIATQGIGSAIIFGGDVNINKLSKGRTILIIGLFIQLVAFGVREL